jgi:hypothetical protein
MKDTKMKNKQRGFTLPEPIVLVLFIIIPIYMAIGWIKDIEKFSECDFQAPYKCEIIHGLGLIPPVGMITGWLNVGI